MSAGEIILEPEQHAALSYAGAFAQTSADDRAVRRLLSIASRLASQPLDRFRPTMNFHPDRLTASGRTVLEALYLEGVYRNQFEVGATNGDATAYPGGRRHQREAEMFGGYYDTAVPELRPKYGSLDVLRAPLGGWPRFGSSYLVLRNSTFERSTFLIGGGLSRRSWVSDRQGIETLFGRLDPSTPLSEPRRAWRTDGWIEMHIHGPVRLDRDVSAIVLDRSFFSTSIHQTALRVANKFGLELQWGPAVISDMTKWKIPTRRDVPNALVSAGVFRDQHCSAAEIGRVLFAELHKTRKKVPMTSAMRDAVAKYFWNRLLLADDVKTLLVPEAIETKG